MSAAIACAHGAPRVGRCRRCRRPMAMTSDPSRAPEGHRTHRGRGLCASCYVRAHVTGEYADYDRVHRPSSDTYAEWALLRSSCDETRIAERLGISVRALRKALREHRRALGEGKS